MQSWVCWRGVGTWRQARHASCTAHSKRILNALPLICTRTESLRKRTTPGSQPISARTARTSSVEAGCVWWWRRWHLGWGSTRGTSMRSCMQVSAPSCASSFPSLSFPFLSFPSPPSLFLLILSSPLHSLTHKHHACHSFPFLPLSFPFLPLSFPFLPLSFPLLPPCQCAGEREDIGDPHQAVGPAHGENPQAAISRAVCRVLWRRFEGAVYGGDPAGQSNPSPPSLPFPSLPFPSPH